MHQGSDELPWDAPPKAAPPTEKELSDVLEKAHVGLVESVGIEHFTANDLEGKDDDDDLLSEYRKKRMDELRAIAGKKRFGYVMELHKSDFVREVNEAGEGVQVVMHLYQPYMDLCKRVNEKLSELAEKFPHVKFIRGVADKIIERYPDYRLPTLFLYTNGDIYDTSFGAVDFGGDECTADSIEWWLASKGVLETNLDEDPTSLKCEMRKLFDGDSGRGYSSAGMDRVRGATDFCVDEEEDDDDEGDHDCVGEEEEDDGEYESE